MLFLSSYVSQSLMRDVTELQQQLQFSTQQLMRKEAELTRAEETIKKEQQQILEMVNLMTCVLFDIVIYDSHVFSII